VLKLREAILKKIVFGSNQLFSLVELLFKLNRRRLVLEASHLECFHNCCVLASRRTRLAVSVQADDLDSARLIAFNARRVDASILQLVLDGDFRARTQLLNKLACSCVSCPVQYLLGVVT